LRFPSQAAIFRSSGFESPNPNLRLPADYFLLTFTLLAQLRGLARKHPREVYAALMQCAWQTLAKFAKNGRGVELGATAVLHTHSRTRDYHPHVHLVVPGGGLNLDSGQWKAERRYLFNSQNLTRVFRAKLLQRLRVHGLSAPADTPKDWVAHCACVGDGDGEHPRTLSLPRRAQRGRHARHRR
jgi:hypothetical protein